MQLQAEGLAVFFALLINKQARACMSKGLFRYILHLHDMRCIRCSACCQQSRTPSGRSPYRLDHLSVFRLASQLHAASLRFLGSIKNS